MFRHCPSLNYSGNKQSFSLHVVTKPLVPDILSTTRRLASRFLFGRTDKQTNPGVFKFGAPERQGAVFIPAPTSEGRETQSDHLSPFCQKQFADLDSESDHSFRTLRKFRRSANAGVQLHPYPTLVIAMIHAVGSASSLVQTRSITGPVELPVTTTRNRQERLDDFPPLLAVSFEGTPFGHR